MLQENNSCTPLLSVIIPVYNVEKYLNECVDSILNQKMKDFEIILVDDGSKDKSGEICDEYAEKYGFIKVIHKENGGLSSARNAGIKEANGEYLIFIDSDDFYINGDFFTKVYERIEKYHPDGILHSRIKMSPNGDKYEYKSIFDEKKLNSMSSYIQVVNSLLKTSAFTISACMIVLKRKVVLDWDLFFKKGVTSEDIEWSMRLYSHEMNLKFIEENYYVYRTGRAGSITNTIKNSNLLNLFDIISEYADKFKESDSEIEKVLLNYIAYQYIILCGLLVKSENKSFKKEMLNKLKQYKWLLNFSLFGKVRKVAFIGKFFGLNALCFILGKYIKYR